MIGKPSLGIDFCNLDRKRTYRQVYIVSIISGLIAGHSNLVSLYGAYTSIGELSTSFRSFC
jgi:hypothetical protein